MSELAHRYDEESVSSLLPDRNDTHLPRGVQLFLSVCEAATISHRYQDWHLTEPQTYFCKGVVDYWWDKNLEEPEWEMLFEKDYTSHMMRKQPIPAHKHFCYQQGAIVGYQLREEYKNV